MSESAILTEINRQLKRPDLTLQEVEEILETLRELHTAKTEEAQRTKLKAELAEFTGKIAGYVLQSHTTERWDTDDFSGICIPGLERVLDEIPNGLKVRVTFELVGIHDEDDVEEWSGQDFTEMVLADDEDAPLTDEEAQAVSDKWDRTHEHDDPPESNLF